jgi:hypothetical protein
LFFFVFIRGLIPARKGPEGAPHATIYATTFRTDYGLVVRGTQDGILLQGVS